ncbi:MAG: Maf family protein [Gemmatimonadota bacterium]|nr:Maf family protein [Gemmatimonadota bacterium]
MSAPRIVLASSSPRRRELLTMIGVAHEVIPANLDESYLPGETPLVHAERLARSKAEAVLRRVPEAIVIGADTIVVIDDEILGKPRDEAHAAAMLRQLSGRTHDVLTAVAVARGRRVESSVEVVPVTFRVLRDDEIEAYIATREPMDKAGAYGIQGYGSTIVRRIDGDFFAVMGLSLVRLVTLLDRHGVRYDFRGVRDEEPDAARTRS